MQIKNDKMRQKSNVPSSPVIFKAGDFIKYGSIYGKIIKVAESLSVFSTNIVLLENGRITNIVSHMLRIVKKTKKIKTEEDKMAVKDRLSRSTQTKPGVQKLVSDLPSATQLNAIHQILAGQNTTNPMINDFVRRRAKEGRNPKQIMQDFVTEQRRSASPLIIMGG